MFHIQAGVVTYNVSYTGRGAGDVMFYHIQG